MAADRKKILARLRNLLARAADQSNAHESEIAKRRLDDHVRKHDITEAEIAAASAQAKETSRRYAEDLDEKEPWRAHIALVVAKKHGCRAMKARGKLFFEGEGAVEATAQYRRIATEALASSRAWWEAHGYQSMIACEPLWTRVFCESASGGFNDPMAPIVENGVLRGEAEAIKARHGSISSLPTVIKMLVRYATVDGWHTGMALARSEAMAVTRAPQARGLGEVFDLRPGFVLVTSGRPGNYATVFVGRSLKLRFRGDLSTLDDKKRSYTWVFDQPVDRPHRLVFATSDRETVADLVGSEFRVAATRASVHRDPSGEPMHVNDTEEETLRVLALGAAQ